MRHDKKMFLFIEMLLIGLFLTVSLLFLTEDSRNEMKRIAVILQDSDSSQWASLKYGILRSAEDQGVNAYFVSTGADIDQEEKRQLTQAEKKRGAAAALTVPDEEAKLSDQQKMGKELGEAILEDYSGSLTGKHFGIVSSTEAMRAYTKRKDGLLSVISENGGTIAWQISSEEETLAERLLNREKVDMIVALDDRALVLTGGYSLKRALHGAVVYGISHSIEGCYYLDQNAVQCIVMPDEFSVGYSMIERLSKGMKHPFQKEREETISAIVMRREDLFSEKGQEILMTMEQ